MMYCYSGGYMYMVMVAPESEHGSMNEFRLRGVWALHTSTQTQVYKSMGWFDDFRVVHLHPPIRFTKLSSKTAEAERRFALTIPHF